VIKKIVLLVTVLTLSSLALAQQGNHAALASAPATSTCAYTFSSGSGVNATKFCVTANGNITQFSNPAGNDHIANSANWNSEGYAICDFAPSSPVAYFDYATNDSGNWLGTSLLSSTAAAVKLQRITSDGLWQITQTITKVNATATSPGGAKVTMAIKNLSGISRVAYFYRFADIDANNDYTTDDQMVSYRQYTAQDAYSYGLALTASTSPYLVEGLLYNTFGVGPDPCNPGTGYVPAGYFHGDGAGVLWYYTTFAKGATKTVTMTYKAF